MNAEQVQSDIEMQVRDLGESFEWTNNQDVTDSYLGIFSPRTDSKAYEMGGYNEAFDWSVVCAVSAFDKGNPGVGDTVYYKGRRYRIVSVVHDPYQAALDFTLTDENN